MASNKNGSSKAAKTQKASAQQVVRIAPEDKLTVDKLIRAKDAALLALGSAAYDCTIAKLVGPKDLFGSTQLASLKLKQEQCALEVAKTLQSYNTWVRKDLCPKYNIDPESTEQGWTFNSAEGTFTRNELPPAVSPAN